MTSSVRVEGLAKAYARRGLEPVRVLEGLELAAEPADVIAITGASGSGKSTLLHVLGGMLAPDAGTVRVGDVEPWRLSHSRRAAWRNSHVGFVFQAARLLSELSALENVLAPAWIGGAPARDARRDAEDLLAALGLAARLHHFPSELSGGEAQRVALARALARSPGLVLADEPTGNLDRATGRRVFDELLGLQRERGFIVIVATHDPDLAARCGRRVELVDGVVRSTLA